MQPAASTAPEATPEYSFETVPNVERRLAVRALPRLGEAETEEDEDTYSEQGDEDEQTESEADDGDEVDAETSEEDEEDGWEVDSGLQEFPLRQRADGNQVRSLLVGDRQISFVTASRTGEGEQVDFHFAFHRDALIGFRHDRFSWLARHRMKLLFATVGGLLFTVLFGFVFVPLSAVTGIVFQAAAAGLIISLIAPHRLTLYTEAGSHSIWFRESGSNLAVMEVTLDNIDGALMTLLSTGGLDLSHLDFDVDPPESAPAPTPAGVHEPGYQQPPTSAPMMAMVPQDTPLAQPAAMPASAPPVQTDEPEVEAEPEPEPEPEPESEPAPEAPTTAPVAAPAEEIPLPPGLLATRATATPAAPPVVNPPAMKPVTAAVTSAPAPAPGEPMGLPQRPTEAPKPSQLLPSPAPPTMPAPAAPPISAPQSQMPPPQNMPAPLPQMPPGLMMDPPTEKVTPAPKVATMAAPRDDSLSEVEKQDLLSDLGD